MLWRLHYMTNFTSQSPETASMWDDLLWDGAVSVRCMKVVIHLWLLSDMEGGSHDSWYWGTPPFAITCSIPDMNHCNLVMGTKARPDGEATRASGKLPVIYSHLTQLYQENRSHLVMVCVILSVVGHERVQVRKELGTTRLQWLAGRMLELSTW